MWKKISELAMPVLLQMLFGILLAAAAALSSLGLMAAAAWLIASAAYQPALHELSLAILGVRVCGITRAVLRYGERYITHDATFRFLSRLRILVYQYLAEVLPLNIDKWTNGGLAALFIREIDTLKEVYLRVLLPLATALVVVLTAGFAFSFYAPIVAVLLFGGFIFIAVVIPVGVGYRNKQNKKTMAVSEKKMQDVYLDVIYGAGELIATSRAADILTSVNERGRQAAAKKIKAFRGQALHNALADAAGGIMLLLTLVMLIPLVSENALSGIQLTVMVFVMQSVLEVLLPLPSIWLYYAAGVTAARKIFALAAETAPIQTRAADCFFNVQSSQPILQAKQLSFSYHGEPAVLKNVTFSVSRGERVAIVGASGTGKSTLFSLLLNLYKQESGELILNDISYCQLSPEQIRKNFNAVMQDTHFFQQTIRGNLQMLCPDATADEMWTALAKAGLDAFVLALPDGLNTFVGQHGRKLSGGQRQRLALAGAVLKPAPILLLDEPTRGLDVYTAKQVIRTLLSLPDEQTVILITHELAHLAELDRIIVLQDGVVAETGSYRELMDRDGVFCRMCKVC